MKRDSRFSGMSRRQRRNKIIAMGIAILLAVSMVLGPILMFFG